MLLTDNTGHHRGKEKIKQELKAGLEAETNEGMMLICFLLAYSDNFLKHLRSICLGMALEG